jgi:probable HAF family extracellular repeat protein
VAGVATIAPEADDHATLWNGSTATELATLGTAPNLLSQANAINDAGLVVGWSQNPATGYQNAILWDGTTLTNLGAFGPSSVVNGVSYSEANGINASGQVVGFAATTSYPDAVAMLWSGGTATPLGILPGGNESEAHGINDAGLVVGSSTTSVPGAQDATLWTGGQVFDLNALVVNLPPTVTLFDAVAVNNGAPGKARPRGGGCVAKRSRAASGPVIRVHAVLDTCLSGLR